MDPVINPDDLGHSLLTRTRRPRGARQLPVHTFRIDDLTWNKARLRATREGLSISRVIATLLDGYAHGHIDMPRVKLVYPEHPKREEQIV